MESRGSRGAEARGGGQRRAGGAEADGGGAEAREGGGRGGRGGQRHTGTAVASAALSLPRGAARGLGCFCFQVFPCALTTRMAVWGCF